MMNIDKQNRVKILCVRVDDQSQKKEKSYWFCFIYSDV